MRRLTAILALLSLGLIAPPGLAQSLHISEMARIKGQGISVLQGLGLVVGLNGTGDSGKELAVARPIAEVLRRNGNPIPDLSELAKSRSVALVMVTCQVPREGARKDDELDVRVSVIHSASSLDGGVLYISPLTAPIPGSGVWAYAQGQVIVESQENPTTGFLPGGAYIAKDIVTTPDVKTSFELVLDPPYAGFRAAAEVAGAINDEYLLTTRTIGEKIAKVIDERTILVTVPESERRAPAGFVGDVMGTSISSNRLGLPAQVICNTRTGQIMVSGDVRISPAVITHEDLVITTTIPTPEPTAADPLVEKSRWAAIGPGARETDMARIQDLQSALNQLAVPANDQIQILQMLHKAGKLHARLIID